MRIKKKSGTLPGSSAQILPDHSIAWGNVIRDVIRVDNPAALAKKLRSELHLTGEERSSYSSLLSAINSSAKNYGDAYILYRAAKIEEERFILATRERLEVMRSDASRSLMAEYKRKERRSPTNDDIEDYMMANWPDEYRTIHNKRAELHGTVKILKNLAEAWNSRCADLRVMVNLYLIRNKKG